MKSYLLGGELVFSSTFIDPTDGSQVDPDAVTLRLMSPDGVEINPPVSNPTLGLYKAIYSPVVAGVWTCRWQGTGAVAAASEYRFEVRPSAFT